MSEEHESLERNQEGPQLKLNMNSQQIGAQRKKEKLGMPQGTAQGKMKKALLFKYVKKAGDNFCYQCGAEIEKLDEFSIEHKIAWQNNDKSVELFFDLDNIAFSHLSCNISASVKRYPNHGSVSRYDHGCRCRLCTNANTQKVKKYRQKKNTPLAQLVE